MAMVRHREMRRKPLKGQECATALGPGWGIVPKPLLLDAKVEVAGRGARATPRTTPLTQ